MRPSTLATLWFLLPHAVSLIAGAFMLLLFISEVRYWRSLRVEDHLLVDTSQGDREFDIAMDIEFHALSCRGTLPALGCRYNRVVQTLVY